ncbi:HAD family hydrolase [Mucilaginibacter ginsenosidivorans]|uniref:phosphoglycolate phosphatase n=1 Tax=Mucilaginibacter ginsenosidivorans TaxID=398053 RepID=A0A5B8UZ30_9SPHI|nr:HAD hydrolase-like protein [Mucilaginibacter ginsenosidivorans]QEC63843.1 haloacid dehalogenase [Mucilaginibacter ginsenosidivorans]
MIRYIDIDSRKDAFIFELDDVLYPEKDYWYQVYYLFASFLEYTEMIDAKEATNSMTGTYLSEGKEQVFDNLKKKLNLDEKYRVNFNHLSNTAKLPLKLLLFQNMLKLLQEIVVDRKKIFIVTNGNPEQQLNKIKQVEWNGLEPYLTCYFANELVPKPETDCIDLLIKDHNLQRRNVLMIGANETDEQCAEASGIDFIKLSEL